MTDQNQHLDGGQLRQKLEEHIGLNKDLTAQLASAKAQLAIQTNGLDLVKPEDLAGIAIEEIDEKAQAIQAERRDAQLGLLKDVLRRNGTPDDQLDAQAEAMLAGQAAQSQDQDQTPQGASWGVISGLPAGTPSPVVDTSQLHGNDALLYGLEQLERQRSKT